MLKKHLKYVNYVIYSFDYLFKRVFPKIFFTRKFYYLFTGGKNRIFSKAEIIGRLYCFGFEVINEKKINNLNYIFARRHKQPEFTQKRIYGPLIRLRRFGKNGKIFDVFKMRTMHPYSEYLQAYIYERNSLQDGGKFNKDTRVTTLGRLMRKYWFDELPMIINLFQGDLKLVGVRPLSAHYFSLYSKELQELRIQFKPGLLPPFYADMPHTLPEIEGSEMRYLRACQNKGIFLTDLRYLFLILKNIFFKKARSS
jgi:lipopolysaccharide/colanic/teichoic acid biosynthesis glycosyltransferase